MGLGILLITILAILTAIKLHWKKAEEHFGAAIIIVGLIISVIQIITQSNKDDNAKRQSTLDSIQYSNEIKTAQDQVLAIQRQNDALTSKISALKDENESLIGSVSSFRTSFRRTTVRQDSISNYMTGGDNLPIIEAWANREAQKGLSAGGTLKVMISNYGLVPLWNLHYRISNPFSNELIEKDIPMLTYQYVKTILDVDIPNNLDSVKFQCNVIWAGLHLRTYSTEFTILQNKDGSFKVKTNHFYAAGEKLGLSFDPWSSKAIHKQKVHIVNTTKSKVN